MGYIMQARSIQELAKRDFENLRHEGDDGELRPKVVRRGRPPSKHLKNPPLTTSISNNGPETSSGATFAKGRGIQNPGLFIVYPEFVLLFFFSFSSNILVSSRLAPKLEVKYNTTIKFVSKIEIGIFFSSFDSTVACT